MASKSFRIPVSDWQKVSIPCVQFILQEAQSYLNYLNAVCDKITARAYSIITLLIPITSALIVFVVNQATNSSGHLKFYLWYTVIVVITLIGIMSRIGMLIMGRKFMAGGHAPKELATDQFLGVSMNGDDAYRSLLLNEIEDCQCKIEYNEKQNSERIRSLNNSIIAIGILLLFSILTVPVYLLSLYLRG